MSSNSAPDAAGCATGRRVGAALAAGAVAAASTSRRTMRPPGPLPWISFRSTPDCAAILRASGDAFTRPPPPVDGTPWGVWGAISGPPISFGELAPARCPDPTVVWGAISGPPISF